MKFIKALQIILSLSIASIVIDASCFQNLSGYLVAEIAVEEPIDEDVTDDTEDDKVHSTPVAQMPSLSPSIAHYTTYLLNHTHQVQETFSPPPEV